MKRKIKNTSRLKKKPDIKAGKKYFMRTPNGGYDGGTVHIDYILPHPLEPDNRNHDIIVYRQWHKYKHYWFHSARPMWEIAMWNDWKGFKL